ncbi:hypothetical protein SAMN05421874_12841 [Nonomuraea maritima]|uniref:Uncharacterized protein n=1 Tax=Nonomuraea maritima TaxID=683260 RepID=A0A1G9MHW7_9ACTN|nr:hypothetical protein [Nonomuraea maritima]SDL73683.1 hypothetical protein SAMN05421874_12841 [Nonomuraea maritima]
MRIQVLQLPLIEMGGIHEEPFALIVDQAQPGDDTESLNDFSEKIGARAMWVTEQTVEVVEPAPPQWIDAVAADDDHPEY